MAVSLTNDIAMILAEDGSGHPDPKDIAKARLIVEDVESPVTTQLLGNIYSQVIEKSHIDFDDIPKSEGDVSAYKGYKVMKETLETIRELAERDGQKDVILYADIVLRSLTYILAARSAYKAGFKSKNEQVIIEYNLFVFCCVEATTAILSQFVEVLKGFAGKEQFRIRNTKYKASLFYLEQLEKFCRVNESGKYVPYLNSVLNREKENFVGATVVGAATIVAGIAVIIIPTLRLLVWQAYHLRSKLSDALAQQAAFLEMNKARVEANTSFDAAKRAKVLRKQEATQRIFTRLSEKLRVDSVAARSVSSREIASTDSTVTADSLRNQVNSAPLNFLL